MTKRFVLPYLATLAVCFASTLGCSPPQEQAQAASEAEPAAACFVEDKDVSASAVNASRWNIDGEPPFLIMHYLPWFKVHEPGQPDARQWRHWRWDGAEAKHDPAKKLENGRRDIASVMYPLIGPYNTWDPHVIRYHLETARAAGVDAALVLWYGPGSEEGKYLQTILDEAEKAGMRIALCYEEKINWPPYRQPASRKDIVDGVADDMNYILENYASHPAYLTRDGKPFIAQFNYWGDDDFGLRTISGKEWKDVFGRLSREVFYCRQNLGQRMHPPIQSAYMWVKPSPAWVKDFMFFSSRAEQLIRDGELEFFMTFVAAGFDDTGVWGWGGGPRKLESNGLELLNQTMFLSTAGDPELIQLVTWNDWEEGTSLEPSRDDGFLYVDTIEQWWGRLKGRPVDLADNREPLRRYVDSAEGLRLEELPENVESWFAD